VTLKPHSAACDRNRDPILAVLREHFDDCRRVLEIGSGTGQHAVHFARALPSLVWQTSDLPENHAGISAWLDEARLPNTLPPLALDVKAKWPELRFDAPGRGARGYDAVFSANTLHIMSWPEVQLLFARLPGVMSEDAKLAIYGPFNYDKRFTSASNEQFDASLKAQAPHMGIRDFEAVDALARAIGLRLLEDRAMPANNRCLVWGRG
jgi:cyclopropane fatty-acyl-phospholipid synthase-like methyltransferase